MSQVKAELDKVKQSCQGLKEEINVHDQKIVTSTNQLVEQKQVIEDMKDQRIHDQAQFAVQFALLRANSKLEMEEFRKTQYGFKEGQSRSDRKTNTN